MNQAQIVNQRNYVLKKIAYYEKLLEQLQNVCEHPNVDKNTAQIPAITTRLKIHIGLNGRARTAERNGTHHNETLGRNKNE
jgi:ribosome-associated translation inhibitor RaiA